MQKNNPGKCLLHTSPVHVTERVPLTANISCQQSHRQPQYNCKFSDILLNENNAVSIKLLVDLTAQVGKLMLDKKSRL